MHYIDQGNGPSLIACTVVPFVITWAFSSVRIYVRRIVLKIWKIEDWLFLASQVAFSFLTFTALMATIYGNGQHLDEVHEEDVPVVMKYWYASELIYTITSFLIRLSIGYFLIRICNIKLHIWTIYITMILMALASAMYFFFIIFQCRPISYFWTRFTLSDKSKTCYSSKIIADLTIIFSVFSALADLVFGILPLFVIWNLKMNRKTKLIVGGLLTLGILAGLSVIIRIIYINSLRDPEEDFTFLTFKVAVWSIIEPTIGICCMAITTYRPLFKSLRDKISQTSRSRLSAHLPGSASTGKRPFPLTHSSNMSKQGYTKTGSSKSSNSYEDVMELDRMQRQPSVSGGRQRNGSGDEEFSVKDGIMFSTTVEVTHSRKQDDDFV